MTDSSSPQAALEHAKEHYTACLERKASLAPEVKEANDALKNAAKQLVVAMKDANVTTVSITGKEFHIHRVLKSTPP